MKKPFFEALQDVDVAAGSVKRRIIDEARWLHDPALRRYAILLAVVFMACMVVW